MPQLFEEDNDLNFPVPYDDEEEETTDTEFKQTLYVIPQRRQYTDKLFLFMYWICFITMIIIGIILVAKKTASLSVAKSLFLPLWNSAGLLVALVSASIVVSLIWLYLLSAFSNSILIMTGTLLPVGIIGVSIASFIRFLQSTPSSNGEQVEFKFMASVCAAGIIGGIYTGYMTLKSKRMVKTMNAIVNLATEILRANSSLFVLSASLSVAHLIFSTFWLYLFSHIFLQGSVVESQDTVITINANTTWLAIYFIVIYFWTSSLLKNLEKTTVSSIVGEWADHINSTDMTWFHFEYVLTRSFGTVAFASLILGLVNTLKFLVKQTEKYGSKTFLRTRFMALLLAFISKAIDDLSSYTLVYVGLSGDPLLTAGLKCSKLFTKNLILGLLTSQMSRLMSFVGKLFVSSVIGLTVFWNYSSQTSQGTEWITVFVSTAIPFYVMGILTHVVETTIDSTFICYLIDLDQNTCSHDKAHRIFAASLK